MVHDLLCLKATMYSIFVSSLAYSLTTLKPLQKKKKEEKEREQTAEGSRVRPFKLSSTEDSPAIFFTHGSINKTCRLKDFACCRWNNGGYWLPARLVQRMLGKKNMYKRNSHTKKKSTRQSLRACPESRKFHSTWRLASKKATQESEGDTSMPHNVMLCTRANAHWSGENRNG